MVKKNSGKKKANDVVINMKKIEVLFCILIFIIFLVLLVNAISRDIFIPACLIMLSLELFAIGYYFRDDKSKNILIYCLFGIGVVLLFVSIIYTIMKMV